VNRLARGLRVEARAPDGLVEAFWGRSETGRPRKYYRLTGAGAEHLDRQRRQWQAVDRTMRGIWRAAVDPAARPA